MTLYKGFVVTRSRLSHQWIATPTQENYHSERLRAATREQLKQLIDAAIADRPRDPWQLPQVGDRATAA